VSRGIAPLIRNLSSRWGECSASHLVLYPRGKNYRYPFGRRLGGLKSRSGRLAEERNLMSGIEPVVFQPVDQYSDYAALLIGIM